MKNVISIYKPLGLSPLQAIRLLKQLHPDYANSRIGYAGRLDPMAEGLLLLLVDEENKKKKIYEDFPKTYEFEVLFGVCTDTYDTLGLIIAIQKKKPPQDEELTAKITHLLPSFLGKKSQPYPPYSSRTVNGKPLYWYAREGKLHEVTIPEKRIEITSIALLSSSLLPGTKFEQTIYERIQLVTGAFRQDAIRASWKHFFISPVLPSHFPVYRFRVECSSGTYVRSIAHSMGNAVGIPALAYSIKRMGIGPYSLTDALRLEPIA